MSVEHTHRAITAVFRSESAKLVGGLVRIVRDVGLAEELAHDALLAALEEWPSRGVPEKPGAWLMTTARNRALNALKHARMADRHHEVLGHEIATHVRLEDVEASLEAAMDEDVTDDALRLIFVACHPMLGQEARVALTLRLVAGLETDEIARAFLAPATTIQQRIVRAKKALSESGVPFEMPAREDLGARLRSVLEVVYLVFNEGYSATAGDDVLRPALCDEAIRLSALLAELAPREPEVHGLYALLELQSSRAAARTDAQGEPVLLMDQDRSRWDRDRIARGLASLARARSLEEPAGPYVLQAEIAACHARAARPEDTDWRAIASHYGELARIAPSPIVELNRAMAISRADGPEAGLALLDALRDEPTLARYPLLPSARADLLVKLGRTGEARTELERAASLTTNARLKERLLARAAAC